MSSYIAPRWEPVCPTNQTLVINYTFCLLSRILKAHWLSCIVWWQLLQMIMSSSELLIEHSLYSGWISPITRPSARCSKDIYWFDLPVYLALCPLPFTCPPRLWRQLLPPTSFSSSVALSAFCSAAHMSSRVIRTKLFSAPSVWISHQLLMRVVSLSSWECSWRQKHTTALFRIYSPITLACFSLSPDRLPSFP